MKNIGIILAGGSGRRLGGSLPKQFLMLAGKTILEHSVSTFQEHRAIDGIFIVTHPDHIADTWKIAKDSGLDKVIRVIPGGSERYHSTLHALQACPDEECRLVIHDAVRPLVTPGMISSCLEALEECAACTTAIPSTDTILESTPDRREVRQIPDRSLLFQVQTPQAFLKSTLEEAYRIGLADPGFKATDDCGVVKRYLPDTPVRLVPGDPSNIKVTYAQDLPTAEEFLAHR